MYAIFRKQNEDYHMSG